MPFDKEKNRKIGIVSLTQTATLTLEMIKAQENEYGTKQGFGR